MLILVIRKGSILTRAGLGAGLAGALAVTRFRATMLYRASAPDPATLVLVPALWFGVAVLACCLPARRAARIDPMAALRCE